MNSQQLQQQQQQQVKSRQIPPQQQQVISNIPQGQPPAILQHNFQHQQLNYYNQINPSKVTVNTKAGYVGSAFGGPKRSAGAPPTTSVITVAAGGNPHLSSNSTPKGGKKMTYSQQNSMVAFDNRKRSMESSQQQQFYYQQHQQQQQQQLHSKSTKVSPSRVAVASSNQSGVMNPLQAKLAASSGIEGQKQSHIHTNLDQVPPHQNLTSSGPGAGMVRVQIQQPIIVNGSSDQQQHQQYFNLELDGMAPTLVSHSTGVNSSNKQGYPKTKDIMANRGSMPGILPSNVNSNNLLQGSTLQHHLSNQFHQQSGDDMNMDASMHQSFINLIYPSKSKKLMSTEHSKDMLAQSVIVPSSGGDTSHQVNKTSSTASIGHPPHTHHHQKSKSLYIGSSNAGLQPPPQPNYAVQNFIKPVAQQLAPKSVQGSVQKASQHSTAQKKQQQIFTYSQRFKELLNENASSTIDGTDPQMMKSSSISQPPHSMILSQQHSPSHAYLNAQTNQQQQNIQMNFNDMQMSHLRSQQASNASSFLIKGGNTFDNKPLVSQSVASSTMGTNNHFLQLTDNNGGIINYQQQQQIKTIEYPSSGYQKPSGGGKNSGNIVMQSKAKVVAEPPLSKNQNNTVGSNLILSNAAGSLHQRKPSHPVTNNFMLELLSSSSNNTTSTGQGQVIPANHMIQTFTGLIPPLQNSQQNGNDFHQLLSRQYQQSNTIDQISGGINKPQQINLHHQQQQPVREKKQHQPTQSKKGIAGQTLGLIPQGGTSHQRSASDYMQNQQYQIKQNEFHENMVESFENNIECAQAPITHSGQVNLTALDSNRQHIVMNNFMQQAFSQMLYDGGSKQLSHRQDYSALNEQQQQLNNLYNYRKMSLGQQQPTPSLSGASSQQTLHQRKSPQKSHQKNSSTSKASTHVSSQKQKQTIKAQQINHGPSQPQTLMLRQNVASPSSKQQIQHHHSSSTGQIQPPIVVLPTNNNNNLLQFQQIPSHQQQIHHNRSNSDLMKQQILAAQAAALKKPQQNQQQQPHGRPNPAINTQQILNGQHAHHQKAKSEMTTPRQIAAGATKQTPGQNPYKKGISMGSTPANVSIDLAKNNVGPTQRQSAMTKNSSNTNLNNHNSALLKRKEQQQQQQMQHTPRLKPNSPQKQQQIAQQKRLSVQSSPRINKLEQNNQGQPQQQQQQYNLSQQYQMFQQVIQKQHQQQKQHIMGDSNSINRGSLAPNLSNVEVQQQDEFQVIKPQTAGNHRRGVSETEFLLNQIRNNINTLKAYQPPNFAQDQASKPYCQPEQVPRQVTKNNLQLQKILEGSTDQVIDTSHTNKILTGDKQQTYKRDNLNLMPPSAMAEDSISSYLQTDPSMSPYSKDLNKLQKLIKFNFRKFSEPPATTSEFYRIGRVLGRGAFGKVNLAAHKLSEQLVAIKSINKEFLRGNKNKQPKAGVEEQDENGEHPEKKKVMQEFAILKQSNHSSVVRLYDTFETSKHICFVMELCAGGDLLTYVRKRRKLTEEVAKYFFKQLIEGLAYLHHSKLIVHRDIKLDNILLDANGKIKIADFGVSRQVHSENERMNEQCGTPAYIAPEILKDKGYDGFKVDVWSAGVCLYAMLIGTVPFKASSMQELHHLIINGKYDINNPNANQGSSNNKDGGAASVQPPNQPQTKLTEHATNLIHQLLQVDPRKRLSAVEVLSHPWLKDAKDEMDIFTQKEKDVIHKEYLSKNIDRTVSKAAKEQTGQQLFPAQDTTEVIFTEHNLDTKTNVGSLLKNASTKSIILAPFNSTVSELGVDENGKEKPYQWPEHIRRMIVPKRVLKFAPKVKDLDRQYEHNNNADLDNGVYNNVGNEENNPNAEEPQNSQISSDREDSLKGSFKETELSSDDEKAEQQLEEARRKQKLQQQSELQEFENQIKLKYYVRYQEPVDIIDMDLVNHIGSRDVYPRDFVLRALQAKDMNYATAMYHLLLKKQQYLAKQLQLMTQAQNLNV